MTETKAQKAKRLKREFERWAMTQLVELEDGTRLIARCDCRGEVRRIKTVSQYVMNGEPAGIPVESAPREYECATCGKKMEATK